VDLGQTLPGTIGMISVLPFSASRCFSLLSYDIISKSVSRSSPIKAIQLNMTVSSINTKLPPESESVMYYPSASAPPAAGSGIPTAHATIVDTGEARLTASAPPGKTIVTKSTYTIPPDNGEHQRSAASQNVIPPGAKPGGVWMSQNYVGPITGGTTCACVLLVFLPGLFMLCFPMDKRYVYQEPGPKGRLLLGSGKRVTGGRPPQVLPPGYIHE